MSHIAIGGPQSAIRDPRSAISDSATAMSDDEFYIGYEGEMPPGIRRRVRAAVIVAGCAAAAVVTIVIFAASTLPLSRFEFGRTTEVTGVLRRVPYPALDTARGRVWLVGSGKSGADTVLAEVMDGDVTARGSRIQRGRHEMLEVTSVARTPGVAEEADTTHERLADVTLRGEIVDSKCFFGVMNPGEGAVHRDCARRCLSGGIPPMLLVRDGAHREELVLLVSADGRGISREMVPIAGTPVEMMGHLTRDRGGYVLYVSGWRRRG